MFIHRPDSRGMETGRWGSGRTGVRRGAPK